MKTIKSLLLGAGAALAMGGAASAADLPAAEPVEYVRICDTYGQGFFFIPGTNDTCMRISGYVRVQTFISSNRDTSAQFDGDVSAIIAPEYVPATPTTPGRWLSFESLTTDNFDIWTRALLRVDVRSRTDWGVLRSFIEWASNGDNGAGVGVRYAFVQVGLGGGTLTAGITDSFMSFGDYGTVFGTPVGVPDGATRRNLLAYTANFGNGISATVALEDSQSIGSNNFADPLPGGYVRQRIELPDLVGQIRVAQSWGVAQLAASVAQFKFRDATCAFPGAPAVSVCEEDEIGWAVRGGVRINLDNLSRGSSFAFSAAYADGLLQHLGGGFGSTGSVLQRGFLQQAANTLGQTDERSIESVTGFSLFGHFQYFFTPALRASLFGGYAELDYGVTRTFGGAGTLGDRAWSIAGNIVWSPVRNLDLGVEVFYSNIRYSAYGFDTNGNFNRLSRQDEDGWGAIFRIQRSF